MLFVTDVKRRRRRERMIMAAAITATVVMISNGGGTKALNRGKAISPSECGGADGVASEN